MGISALALDHYSVAADSVARSDYSMGVDEVGESFASHLSAANDKKCPYSLMARDGVISYNGVTFICDYQQNAITLGNMYEKEKVLKIYLPSGGALHVNVDNIDQLSKAAGMFTPEDLNAIIRAIHQYNHCTRKRHEIEEEKSKPVEDTAAESETPDAEEARRAENEARIVRKEIFEASRGAAVSADSLLGQIGAFRTELFYKLLNNETEVKIQIGGQEFSEKEWKALMER